MDSYEKWTRSEIARLRTEARNATVAADEMQRSFDKWLVSQGRQGEAKSKAKPEESHGLNGHAPRRVKKANYGDKNATALAKIKAMTPSGGITTDELFDAFVALYGPKYKRSSLRAMLWHQKDIGNIENRDGRYVIASKGATA
jgi:hypothetical protein